MTTINPRTKPCSHCEGEMVHMVIEAQGEQRRVWLCLDCAAQEPTQEQITKDWGEA